MECIFEGNDSELIPMVETETRNPIEGYFGSEFLAINRPVRSYGGLNSQDVKNFLSEKFLRYFL